MAKLYISEYPGLARTPNEGLAQTCKEPAIADQVVDFTSGEDVSDAFNDKTNVVYISTDTACHFEFGADPEATTSNKWMPAGGYLFLGVTPGHKIAVIGAT